MREGGMEGRTATLPPLSFPPLPLHVFSIVLCLSIFIQLLLMYFATNSTTNNNNNNNDENNNDKNNNDNNSNSNDNNI